jgi:glycosyltransferase involved in cell wall biosynthesis
MSSVLLAHNFYGSTAPSGENQVFLAERELLLRHGHTVHEFARHSDTLRAQGLVGALRGALSTAWNPFAAAEMRRTVRAIGPDVVHVHNTFPLISPSIFSAIGSHAARVLTLHNYRLFCAAAIPLREGAPCTDCLDWHSALPALVHGCYRGSRAATLPLAASVELHRRLGTWTRHVDAFIALSGFQRDMMIGAGLPAELVHVKPNFFPGDPAVVPWSDRRARAVFAGRLSGEKGVHSLVRAWKAWGAQAPELVLVGDGPQRGELERAAVGAPVRFLGQLPSADALAQIAESRLLVLPSEWFEGFPMVLREAFAMGTPAAVSAIGPLPDIVGHGACGLLFAPSNPESLLQTVRGAWEREGLLERLGQAARAQFDAKYNESSNYATLMSIYERAMVVGRERSASR